MIFKRKNKHKFSLDAHRIVEIDGHEYVIMGFSADSAYIDKPTIHVTFAPLERYKSNWGPPL